MIYKAYNNSLSRQKFSLERWNKTLEFTQEIISKLEIKDYVFIKDFKNVNDYYGSNIDVYIWNKDELMKVYKYLTISHWFKLPKIDFEYDKYMLVPPWFYQFKHQYLPIHLYPYIWWYTLRLNLFNSLEIVDEIFITNDLWFRVLNQKFEFILILFHWYLEDRKIADYDILHLNSIIENGLEAEDFVKYVNSDYLDTFLKIYNYYINNNDKDELIFKDYFQQMKFAFWLKDSVWHKLYYFMIHTLKCLKIIRW